MSACRRAAIASILAFAAACTAGKADVEEDFTDLAGLDGKADAFSYRLKLLGELASGVPRQVLYKSTPRFRGFTIHAAPGDTLDLWVRGPRGDAVTWLLDDRFRVVGSNDDAGDDTLDSFIGVRLAADQGGLFYVVFRDYYLDSRRFTVELTVTPGHDPFAGTDPLARSWVGYAAANDGSFGWPMGPEDLSPAARAKLEEYEGRHFPAAIIRAYGFPNEAGETALAVVGCQEEIGWVDLFGSDGQLAAHGAAGDGCAAQSWSWQPASWDPSVCDCDEGGYPACRWC